MTETNILTKEHQAIKSVSSAGDEVVLSQIATLLRAPLFKTEKDPNGSSFRVLSVIDIKEYGHSAFPGKEIRLSELIPKAKKYCLKPYDVVISIVGTVGRICIIPETVPDNWIPTSNMLIVRFKENKQSQAIAFTMLMHSEQGQKIFEKLIHGNKILMISKKEFAKIRIPVLSDEKVREARTLYDEEEKLAGNIDTFLAEISAIRKSFRDSAAVRESVGAGVR